MKQKLAFAFIMGIITTGLVSFTLISVTFGFTEKFLAIWLRSWAIAFVPAISSVLLIAPKVTRFVQARFGNDHTNNSSTLKS